MVVTPVTYPIKNVQPLLVLLSSDRNDPTTGQAIISLSILALPVASGDHKDVDFLMQCI